MRGTECKQDAVTRNGTLDVTLNQQGVPIRKRPDQHGEEFCKDRRTAWTIFHTVALTRNVGGMAECEGKQRHLH